MEDIMDKREIRREMRMRRRALPPDVRADLSAEICERLLERPDVKAAIAAHWTFAAYLASADEIDLSPFIERLWSAGCTVAVPAWRNGSYVLVRYSPDSVLESGPMGIREPAVLPDELIPLHVPSVWIVPGLAFTKKGVRLGYGGGWYDRFLSEAALSAVSLGVAYPFQIVSALPVELHDKTLSDIVTV